MKEITLERLVIDQFKGCRHLELDMQGRNVSIYGDNAAGKTTVYDALTWLLFGKDSKGASTFEIKPLGADGQVADHAAVTEVSAELSVDGAPVALRKTFYERWSTKRGSADATYDGNTSEYFVDDVPVKKYEFERRVGEIVSEELFRTLTNVTWFCEGLGWQARRDILMKVCGAPEDAALMAQNPMYAELSADMGALSLDDYKKKLLAQRKGLNAARNTVPARLDEQRKTIEALADMDFSAVRREKDEVDAKAEKLNEELLALHHGALVQARRNELAALENNRDALENRNNSHRQSQMVPVEDKRPELAAQIAKAKRELTRWTNLEQNEQALMEVIQGRIADYRARWATEDARTFDGLTCPTCGQAMPEKILKASQAQFEADKARRKAEVVASADREKANLAAAKDRREKYIAEAVAAENEIARLNAELAACASPDIPEITDLPEYAEHMQTITERMTAVREEVAKLESESAAIREEITGRLNDLRAESARLGKELSKEGFLDFARKREEELRQEARAAAEELAAVDRRIALCEDFARYKVQCIEESINSHFRMARWRLFTEQVNGGLADCCEATYGGVPYGSLNNGARINLGVDVIRTISEHYGLRVPLVVDNAESVVDLLDAGTQVIRLVVSGEDKKLRCEYED